MAARFSSRTSFAVPATSGTYAPERITFGSDNPSTPPDALLGLTSLLESAPAGAVVEVWLPKIGAAVPAADADYFFSGDSHTSGRITVPLASWPGAQIRVKSGGTAGTAVVNATAD